MKKTLLYSCAAACLLAFAPGLHAQTTTVYFNSGSTDGKDLLYSNKALTALLTAGNVNTSGDGAILRLGYYQNATTTNVFGNGTFVPLSGAGSSDTYTTTSVGDDAGAANGPGTFAMSLSFSTASGSLTGNNLPTAGTPLAIQFFNGTSLTNSTTYNAVSDSLWTWNAPQAPSSSFVFMSFDDFSQSPLQWLGGDASAFYTSLPASTVPEPSTWLMGIGIFAALLWKRRFQNTLR